MSKARGLTLRMVVMLVIVAIVFGGVFGWGYVRGIFIAKFLAGFGNQTQTVATIIAPTSTWQTQLKSVGSLTAVNGASISAETAGIVDSIKFQSGTDVPAGALLVTLRPNNDDAVLAQLKAQESLDQITYDRDVKQFAADAIAKAQLDTDSANLAAIRAQVQAQQALMDEKKIRAPFAGRLGIRQVNLGEYLPVGTPIVTLQQLNPLFVDFYLPQQALSQISVGQSVDVAVDAFPGKIFTAKISSINSVVDTATRNVQVRATLANDGLTLRPGMFATISIGVGAPQKLVTLPQTAITFNPYGSTVFVVTHGKDAKGKADLVAHSVFVTTGDTRGDQIAVLTGLKAGEQVVTAGQLKLRNNTPVAINNVVQPPDDANPNPPNE
ncbi:MAG: efflux RND transporter periplasmic adaptor subunit [Acidocella sp.]|nr:efflux RND transporter periplasmic adaptor subunit [Acidocella sp.]